MQTLVVPGLMGALSPGENRKDDESVTARSLGNRCSGVLQMVGIISTVMLKALPVLGSLHPSSVGGCLRVIVNPDKVKSYFF